MKNTRSLDLTELFLVFVFILVFFTQLLPRLVEKNKDVVPESCYQAAVLTNLYDEPNPFTHVNSKMNIGEVATSYNHTSYTHDGWRYVYNSRVMGWARNENIFEVPCK